MSSEEKNKRHGHEHSDWNLTWVVGGGITLIVSVAIMLIASWWIFREFQYWASTRQLGTVTGPPAAPPEPRLQVSPTADWSEMLEREQAILHSYGWVDRSRGIVRIPIERQMEIVARGGFPQAKAARGQTK
jgi:hypothetical protein